MEPLDDLTRCPDCERPIQTEAMAARAALQAAFEDACADQADMAERHMRESNDMAQRVWDAAMAITKHDQWARP